MNILITGANGFLGSFLCKKLEINHTVYKTNSKDHDLTKENSLDVFNEIKFDLIFHLAAWTQAGDFCLHYPADQWVINQKINTNVLTYFKNYQSQAKIICMGTSCSYDASLDHIEENYLLGKPIDSLFTYAMTKRMLLTGLIALNKQYNLNYLYFIPSTLYGPNYHTDGRQMHFVFDLIRKIMQGKYLNSKVELWGDGYQTRELVYVNDFIDTMLKLIETENNTIINIGSGVGNSIRDFANSISKIIDFDSSKIKYDTTKYVGAKSKVLNINKLNKIMPNYKTINLQDGLKNTINWFYENKEKLFKN